ncbi:hypothetical protein DLAC_04817 [Tieghemostelium lacteum]|uniref:Ribosomal protein L7/L12 C-terminal domain-containing protein n=1 Tax=Tieghemostelium lacteum TaxID=361077 RepID=A0A151ZJ67_TIELA|nr:hypothetical protein DLAC_04817 [Tieghemostelium lacteum]|eukprot:KYQ93930.1 hypothetical protein DLAC_04817 [Tieghemostelium lacteum]
MFSRSISKGISSFIRLNHNNNYIYRNSRFFSSTPNGNNEKIPFPTGDNNKEISEIVDRISKLSILEVIDLTAQLQKKLGVPDIDFSQLSAGGGGAPAGGANQAASAAATPAAAKTEFQVKLTKVPDGAKYKIIKELREAKPSLSLMETKGLVEKCPSVIADKVSKEEADKIVAKLKAAGAELEVA